MLINIHVPNIYLKLTNLVVLISPQAWEIYFTVHKIYRLIDDIIVNILVYNLWLLSKNKGGFIWISDNTVMCSKNPLL